MNTFNMFKGRTSRSVILLAIVVFLFSILPIFSYAADGITDTFTGQIVPCGVQGSDTMCGYCDLFTLGQNVINFMVYLAVIIAVLLFVAAGFELMFSAGNAGKVSHAKGVFIKAFVGLIIVLASWLIVDLVMKSFFNETAFGPWNPVCVQSDLDASVGAGAPSTGGGVIGAPGGVAPDGTFSYDSGILAQRTHASLPLDALLSCMAGKVPGDVGRISSISDSVILSGSGTFSSCVSSGSCSHVVNSCHYGGASCTGSSYAVDFGDEENYSDLRAAALECNGSAFVLLEGDHVHISVGAASGCDCDTSLASPPPTACVSCVTIDSSLSVSGPTGDQVNSTLNEKLVALNVVLPGELLITEAYPAATIAGSCVEDGSCVFATFSSDSHGVIASAADLTDDQRANILNILTAIESVGLDGTHVADTRSITDTGTGETRSQFFDYFRISL